MSAETVFTIIIGAASVISPAIIIAVLIHTNNSLRSQLTREHDSLVKKVDESIRHIIRAEEKLDSHTTNYDIHKKDSSNV